MVSLRAARLTIRTTLKCSFAKTAMLDRLNHQKRHGQYYTGSAFGRLLVERFEDTEVRTAIELGLGNGSLLTAVQQRWPLASSVSVDIDPAHSNYKFKSSHTHFCMDALHIELPRLIGLAPECADVAVCNPPFVTPRWKSAFNKILERAGFPVPTAATTMDAGALFLAQNLWILRKHGQLGIIVPDGIISGQRNRHLRDRLLTDHSIREVIELPTSAFVGTEVKTFILSLTKEKTSRDPIRLLKCTSEGEISEPIQITQDEASQRLDYSYYEWAKHSREMLSDSNVVSSEFEIIRGSISTAQARVNDWKVLHTTDLKNLSQRSYLKIPRAFAPEHSLRSHPVAVPGDILVTRVGRNLEEKTVLVVSGRAAISDCLYILRLNGFAPKAALDILLSVEGKDWIRAHTRGACAQFISKTDLAHFPLLQRTYE